MANKTISIDKEAYDILKSHQLPRESLSEVIKKKMVLAGDLEDIRLIRRGIRPRVTKKHASPR